MYEYMVIDTTDVMFQSDPAGFLRAYGKEGWMLTTFLGSTTDQAVLMRDTERADHARLSSVRELPGISPAIVACLQNVGIITIDQLCMCSPLQVLRIPGIGEIRYAAISSALSFIGRKLSSRTFVVKRKKVRSQGKRPAAPQAQAPLGSVEFAARWTVPPAH